MKDKIEKLLIDIAIKNAKEKKGCIFVILEKKLKFSSLIAQDIKPFNIFKNERRLRILSTNDGACIIDLKGKLICYSANILNVKTFKGYGLRHSASSTASKQGNTSIMSSEEDSKVRIFKGGRIVMQIDALEKDIEKKTSQAVSFLESIGFGAIGVIGTSILMPTIGLSLIPGVIIFGGGHYLIKLLIDNNKHET